jgi:hypothetical protein
MSLCLVLAFVCAVRAQNMCSLFFAHDENDGNFAGVDGADSICQTAFMSSAYRTSQTNAGILYGPARAWVSTSRSNVRDRLGSVPDVCVEIVNRERLANSFAAFRTMPLLRAPNMKVDGKLYNRDKVFTATTAAGVHIRSGEREDDSCDGWTSSNGEKFVFGLADDVAKWSNDGIITDNCEKDYGIYCFVPVIVPTPAPTPKPTPAPVPGPTSAAATITTRTPAASVEAPLSPTPAPTPSPTPVAGSPCISYTSCEQCVDMSLTQHVCRFCGSTCQDDSDGCAALPSVATGAACPTRTQTTSSTTPGGTSAVTVTAADSAGVSTEPSSGGLETGAIVGIVVGVVCCALISALVLVAIVRLRGKSDATSDRKSAEAGVPLDARGKSEYGSFPSDSREALPALKSNYASPNAAVEYRSARAFEDDEYAVGRVK